MKIDTKKIDALKREINIEIPKDVVKQKFDEIYAEIGKSASVKGFRPGKAPRDILEKHHAGLAQEEVLKDLIPQTYQQAIEQEKLEPVDLPEVSDVKLVDGIVSFKAVLEVKPQVNIKNYKALKVKRKKAEVVQDDLNKSLETLKTTQGLSEDAKLDDSFAKGLGFANLDELKENIKKQLELMKNQQARQDMENQIIDQLLSSVSFEVPEAPVKKQLEYMVRDTKMRMGYQGMKKEDIESKEPQLREQLKDDAQKAIKLYFILDKIAQLENLDIKEDDQLSKKVIEFLLKEAQWREEA